MSRIRTSLPIPTQPWEAAKKKFLEGLSPEQAKQFHNATIENLFYSASAAQKKHAQGSKSWMMQERLTSLVDGIDDYGKALDVYSNAAATVMGSIWGSIRVVLHVRTYTFQLRSKLAYRAPNEKHSLTAV